MFHFIIALFSLYSAISIIVVVYCQVKRRNLDYDPILGWPSLNKYFFYVGAFLALLCVFIIAFDRILIFIPEDWGYINEDGEFSTFKGLIGGVVSMFGAGYILYLIDQATHKKQI